MRLFILGISIFMTSQAYAAQLLNPLVGEKKVMGKPLRIEQKAETVPSQLGVVTSTETEFLGHSGTLMEASVEAIPNEDQATPSGTVLGRTDLYIGGTRVWTGALRFDQGALIYSGGVAPVQIPFPILIYPLGPVMLRVDAGIEFEGQVDASLTPGLSYPLTDSSLDAKLQAELGAAGFIEGYASIWLVRAGVGGRIDVIEGTTGVAAHLRLNGLKPSAEGLGRVRLLNGGVYGFVDTKLFFGSWKTILKKDFFKWDGWCYSFGAATCATP